MQYRKLGASDLTVSEISLGSWLTFGVGVARDHALACVKRAFELGINFIDTANAYGRGAAESFLGEVLASRKRDSYVLATKVFFPMSKGPNGGGLSRKSIFTAIDASLRRLGTDYVDLYQIHRWDPTTPIEETLEALHDVVKAGKARYLGASSMYAWQFAKALHLARENRWTPFVSMQNFYNLLYREEEREMLPLCSDARIAVLPWSPLARGRLARAWDTETPRTQNDMYVDKLFAASMESDRKVVEQVDAIAKAREVPRAQVALAWVLQKSVVTAPIVGASRPQHLDDALAALTLDLTESELAQLEAPYVPHPVVGHQ